MSRSRRNRRVTGITIAASEKAWKRKANRKLRRASTVVLQAAPAADRDAIILPVIDEVANQYDGPKDGKFRFDPKRHPRLMRK